jgi:glycine/D-amino acid oxidase-like deaminating enzyme
VGQERAVDAYRGCLAGLSALSGLARQLGDVGFRRRSSLYLASNARDAKRLQKEGRLRRRFGLPCDTWGRRELAREFEAAPSTTALWTTRAAEVDPYRLCRALLARCQERDFVLALRTTALGLVPQPRHVEVHTDRGVLRAAHVVVAAGYESARFLPAPVASLHSTFAVVTEPLYVFDGWPERCLIWESARPYLYLRTTSDGRVLVGGRDVRFQNAQRRDARVHRVARQLLGDARRLLPRLELVGAYAWAGTFGETKDGLGYIGPHPALDERICFALGYGGNGITYSVLAARVLTARILGRKDRYASTFAFDR